jgi:DNA polymerase-3 subunit epsilon
MRINWFKKNKTDIQDESWKTYLDSFHAAYPAKTPIEEVRFVVFDTETTGLDHKQDHILSIGALAVLGNQIDIADRLECYVQQSYQPKAETVAVHGILSKHPASGLAEWDAIKAFLAYIGPSVLVAHNAAFDISMVNHVLAKNIGKKLKNKYLDTSYLAKRLAFNGAPHRKGEYTLDNMCRLYQIPASDRHTAAGDALITAILLLKLLARLKKRGIHTLGDLLRPKRVI